MPYTTHGHWPGPGQPIRPAPHKSACGGAERCPDCIADATADLLGAVTGRVAAATAALRDALEALKKAEQERDENAAKLAALVQVKTWRNEDGKAFVFVEDLLDAIGHPTTRTENADVS
ncbi:hypothetical protein [Actinomadura bangladeshensis]|uniref:Uncharacterized protein n=1 Tax=Actinomadura bangladeshensis TaxID=453573 RepID=A0A6L9QC30_9ACTN|nr:hypothetical protein [Actinomadura bangladeshensis]NEA22652.1 hypothetical protein [Actinomadura bangladeshensis]